MTNEPLSNSDDSRTVAGVAHLTTGQARKLGIDPDMPYATFRRRLEMGERAEKAAPAGSMTTPTLGYRERDGWDACLDYIRGDQ